VVRDKGGHAPYPFLHFLVVHGVALIPDASQFVEEFSTIHKGVRGVWSQGRSVEIGFHLRSWPPAQEHFTHARAIEGNPGPGFSEELQHGVIAPDVVQIGHVIAILHG
jgi:hypothetical protein